MGEKRNQHTVPQCYLRGFTDCGKVYVYDRMKGNLWHQRPREVAKENHFYSMRQEDGGCDTRIEDMLSRIESATAPALNKVSKRSPLNNVDKSTLARFVSYQMVRVPRFRRLYEAIVDACVRSSLREDFASSERARQTLIDDGENHRAADFNHIERLVRFVTSDAYRVKADKNFGLSLMMEIGRMLGRELHAKQWIIYIASGEAQFISSDNPVSIVPPPGEDRAGVLTPRALVLFPLSKYALLVMKEGSESVEYKESSETVVFRANCMTAESSRRFIYAARQLPFRRFL